MDLVIRKRIYKRFDYGLQDKIQPIRLQLVDNVISPLLFTSHDDDKQEVLDSISEKSAEADKYCCSG